ncbi:hypothetical protein T265_04654 [Opisthorchis viverrini]|uniref:Uncharacterized protein n=1 Tax=Opisthorchis viverrini TaxID=6198 RepID=A0A074ZN11_OPIVI|nr:hypothetical protein T265_04654 [Opisthorchis viverrini]KER28516.1 hypothetical protein T265_04654 [Opisthorchis viverrini]
MTGQKLDLRSLSIPCINPGIGVSVAPYPRLPSTRISYLPLKFPYLLALSILSLPDPNTSFECSVTDEVSGRTCNAQVAFANLKHLWRQGGYPLQYGLLCCLADTWPVWEAETGRFQVLDNACLKAVGRVVWCLQIHQVAVT